MPLNKNQNVKFKLFFNLIRAAIILLYYFYISACMESDNTQLKTKSGFTLVEVIIGTALLAVVFVGIFGAYRLSLKISALSKNKVTATAIANGEIETIRNLSYDAIGTVGAVLPQAAGALDAVSQKILTALILQSKEMSNLLLILLMALAPPIPATGIIKKLR